MRDPGCAANRFVRSSETSARFPKKTDNLFSVAITRAKAALIVGGDPAAAKNAGVTYLGAFTGYVENLGRKRQVASVNVA